MRSLSVVACLIAGAVLAACGGNSNSLTGKSTTTTTTTTTPTVASIAAAASSPQVAGDGSTTVTITATATNSAGAAVAGATVAFTTSAGAITVTQATTSATGAATATLTAKGVAIGTSITVTATSGGISGTVAVAVVNLTQTITLTTSVPQIQSDGSTMATITAGVRNAGNQFVSGVAVGFTATSGGLVIAAPGTTGANGTATATLSAAGDPTNRVITVTATAGSSSANVPVNVIGTTLTVTGPPSLVQGAQGTFSVALSDGSPATGIANQLVTVTSAKGNPLSAKSVTTAANGQATFTLTAATAGSDTITATALGLQATQALTVSNESFSFAFPAAGTDVGIGSAPTPTPVKVNWSIGGVPQQAGQVVNFSATRGILSASSMTTGSDGSASVTITSTTAGPSLISATGNGVSAQVAIEFVATTPAFLNLQASPSTIAAVGTSTITATVTDVNGNLVENKIVDFSLTDLTGGSLSSSTSITGAQGEATTVYTATTATSTLNGVQIQGTVEGTSVTNSTSLTVGGETVFLSLGTGNKITAYSPTQYEMPYTIQAVDAAGNGVNGTVVSFSVRSVAFRQGTSSYSTVESLWVRNSSTSADDPDAFERTAACQPGFETINGILTAIPGSVASTDVGTATTATAGTATVNLIYPSDHSLWVAVQLTATATVSGTQSSTSATFYLPGLSTDFSTETQAPPGLTSPYGSQSICLVPD